MGGDVGDAGRGPGVLDQDLAVGGGEDDRVGVPGDLDVASGVRPGHEEGDGSWSDGAVGPDPASSFTAPRGSGAGRRFAGREGGLVVHSVGSGRVGDGGGVPRLLRGGAPGRALVGAPGVVEAVEGVDPGLEVGDGLGRGLLVEVAEQSLVEALVVARGWWVCRACR